MNAKLNLFQPRFFCALALGVGSSFSLVPQCGTAAPADSAPAKTSIPWSQIGAKAGVDYQGDGLAISPIPQTGNARLRCVFQRLEGEATRGGLWLSSTVTNGVKERFRVVVAGVGRRNGLLSPTLSSRGGEGEHLLGESGRVSIDGQVVRFIRPGLVEEYSVSMDGVRQDFVVVDRPKGEGELAVRLAVSGAKVEPAAGGARLVLENSGRKIAYSRLRVTDANGKELPAHIQVRSAADDVASLAADSLIENQKSKIKNQKSAGSTLAVIINDTNATYPIRIDPTFSDANWISMGGIPGADSRVYAAVVDGSGNLYIGGYFTLVGEAFATNIAKWNGSSWSALGSGMNSNVYALAVSGSDLYAGGFFTNAGGSAANYIAKWNGSSWTNLGSGMNGYLVYALAVSGSDLYAGGYFTNAGGIAANNIAKWNGSSWSGLGSGMDPYGLVHALAVSGSDLYAGGNFTNAGGSAANYIAKWDGSGWSALGSGMGGNYPYYGTVGALAVSGSDVYAGGYFTTAGGSAANYIAKWNGSSWSALGSGMGGYVVALAVSGSDLYAGGYFYGAGGGYASGIAKWNGSSWSALGSGMGGINSYVYALAVSGSNLYAGGDFTVAGGNPAHYIAKWDGSSWSALGSGLYAAASSAGPFVYALVVSGSNVYVGGFGFYAAIGSRASIAKWNGSSWSALVPGPDGDVYALAVSGSDLYAGGDFTTAGGSPASRIAKWNGSSWTALGSGMVGDGLYATFVSELAVSGSDLYAGGNFTTAGGSAATNIAKWNGSSWSALGSGVAGPPGAGLTVYVLAVSGSDLYAGGSFTTAGGGAATNIAKWNGSSWSALGSGMDGGVGALAVSGSDLYAGGAFTTAGGIAATNIAKWNGSSWSALGSGINSNVYALAVSGSDLYAGGYFSNAGGIAANNLAKWNGSSWSALGSGIGGGGVSALAVSGSDLYAGGQFTTAGGKVSAYVARAIVNPPVLAIEGDGDGGYFIRFSGVPGAAYRLQRAPNLAGPWATSSPQTAPASGLLEFWDIFPPPGQGLYRSVGP